MFSIDNIVNIKEKLNYKKDRYSVPEFGNLLTKLNKIIDYEKDIIEQKNKFDKFLS